MHGKRELKTKMTEEDFIHKLKEIGFESTEIIGIQNSIALKSLCAILAQMGILNEWDRIIGDERLRVLNPFLKAKSENPSLTWEDLRKRFNL